MPLRILQVITQTNAGGIETLLMNFYRNIDREKVQFDFLKHRSETGFYDDEILSLGGRIYSVPQINPLRHRDYIRALDLFFHEHMGYQIVHSHINTFSMYPLRAAMKAGVQIRIAHSHIANPKYDYKAPFKIYAKSKLKNFCTHLFACSQWAGEWLYGSDSSFKIINNAIDASKFQFNTEKRQRVRDEFSINGKIVLGHVGRFNKQKNHSFLLDIFNIVHKKNHNTVLLLVGSGELCSHIKKKAYELGIQENVIFAGVRSDVYNLLQAMDIFVFPSFYEGLPVTVVEAQASGLPCLISDKVTNEVGITDLVSCLSLDKGAEYWAREVLRCLEVFQRRNTYKEIIEAGYDIQENTNTLQSFYLSVVTHNTTLLEKSMV